MAEPDPYDPNTYAYQWALPPPPPAPPKEVGVLGGLTTAARRAPATIGSQFKSLGAGLLNTGQSVADAGVRAILGPDADLNFGQGTMFEDAQRDLTAGINRSALLDRAYEDYRNPMPQAGLGKYSAMLGDSLAQGVPALGAGLLTGGLGAFGTMAGQYYGESRLSQLEENPNAPVREGRAALAGLASAGVDMTLGRFLGGGLNKIDGFAPGLFGSGIGGSATRGVVTGVARGAVEEGIAEVLQQGIDRAQVGLDLTGRGATNEYLQAFTSGALLGGGMGGVSGGLASAYDSRQAQINSPAGIVARAESQRQSGAEGRLRNLMAESEADAAYNQLNPSPIASSLEGLGDTISRVVGGEIADGRQASRLIRDRQQGELLALPAPDPMAYDPSGVTARPATQEEYRLAQQIGGQLGVDQVLALPNPNTAPVQVGPDGTAVRTDDPEMIARRDAQTLPVDREQQRAELIQTAATTQRTQSEPSSPFETKAMLSVRGKPAYTVTVVGRGTKPDTVKAFNNDTRKMIEVPRSRVVSVPEPRDPAIVARLPLRERRAEEIRAKDLHRQQIEAILNPPLIAAAIPEQSVAATEVKSTAPEIATPTPAVEPVAVAQEDTAPEIVPEPVNETPVSLTGQDGRVNETPQDPVNVPQDRPMAPEGMTSYRLKGPYGYVMIGAKSDTEAMSEAARSTDNPDPAALEVWDGQKYVPVSRHVANMPQSAAEADPRSITEKVKSAKAAIANAAKAPFAERQRLAQVGETRVGDVTEITQSPIVQRAELKAAQSTTGPSITNLNGPELSAAVEPMSTTDDDAVFAIQQVQAATLDPNFRSQLMIAMREEFRALGFNGRIPLALNFTDAAGPAGMFTTQGDKATITIALGLANDMKNIPSAVQALRPFLTHEVVEFAEKFDLLEPDEREALLNYAKETKGLDGKTLYETVVDRYGSLAKSNNQPESYLEREAVAYATEYLTRLNPKVWATSPDNPARASSPKGQSTSNTRNLRRLKSAPAEPTKAANSFKAKIKALGASLFKGMAKTYPSKQANGGTLAENIALRLAKGDIAHRARINPRFAQDVKFAGWAAPPAQMQDLGNQLRHYMDGMGLPDVGLRLATSILKPTGKTWSSAADGTLGSYHARTITISMANYDPDATIEDNLQKLIQVVDHEAVHALRATGAWTPSQWMSLVKFAHTARDPATEETYFEKASRMYGAEARKASPAVAQDVLNEEAVAMAFADNFDVNIPRASGPRKLLDILAQSHLGIASALYAKGIKSPEMVMANGASAFDAIRAGEAAKNRRELGASSPAEIAVKFALADSKTEKVNPAMEPDPDPASMLTKLFDASYRTRNPLQAYTKPDDRVADITSRRQRERSILLRIPLLGSMLDPRASMADPDLFTLLRSETLGNIHDQNNYIVDLKLKAEKIVGSNAPLEKSVRDYITTKDADPSTIPDAKLAAIVAEMKTLVSTVGRNLVDLGLLSKESYESMDGSYLHRRYLDSAKIILSSTRLKYGDTGFLNPRTNPNIAERAAKGEEVDTLTSVTAYLAKATHAMYIANMHQTMLGVSAIEDPNVRHWVIGAEDTVLWNGKRNSPFAVEAEIDSNLSSIQDLQANLGLAKNPETAAKNKAKVDKAAAQVAGKARVLLRNKLWLGRKGANPTQVVEVLGIELSQSGTVPEDALTSVPDNQVIQLFSQIRGGGIDFSNVQRNVVWREKVWSVLDMEREIARIEDDVYAATEPTGPDDTMRTERLKMAKDSVRTGKIELMRNTLWQNLRQVNPDEVVAELGDFSETAVNQAYDNLRTRHALTNYGGKKDGIAARAVEMLKSYIPGVTSLSDNVVQVPDTPRWGALRGMLMAREVYDIMNGTGSVIENTVDNERSSGNKDVTISKVTQQMMAVYKGAATVLNPGTHMTNWVGNIIQGSMYGGVDPVNWTKHIGFAVGEVLNADGTAYNALRERGGTRGSNSLADISLVTDPMRNSMERAAREVLQDFDLAALKDDPSKVAKAFMKYGEDLGKAGFSRIADFYQLSDTVMKVALMRCHMERGLTADESFLNAQDVFFDYGMVPPLVRAARNIPFVGSPFISWTYMASALTINSLGGQTILRRFADGTELKIPNAVFLAPWILMYAGVQAANLAADDMEDEDRKYLVAGLPDFAKKGFGFMYSRIDANGRPQMLDFIKYASFGTLVKIGGIAGEMQGKSNDVGIPGILKELGFLGSDPGFQMIQAVSQETRSGRSDAKVGTAGVENTSDIVTRLTDIFLPPLLRGIGNGTNPIIGKTGLLRSTPETEDGTLPYQGQRPALSFWQKAAKIAGFGVYVVDVVPALEDKAKRSKALVGDIKRETRAIYNDAYMSEEEKTAEVGKLKTRAERVLGRAAADQALLEEAVNSEFYRNYRANVMAMGLPDPVVSNAESKRIKNIKLKDRDYQAIWDSAGIDTPAN